MVLCSIALYKMKYLRSAPKSGRRSYPAAAGCSLQRSTGPFACRSRGCLKTYFCIWSTFWYHYSFSVPDILLILNLLRAYPSWFFGTGKHINHWFIDDCWARLKPRLSRSSDTHWPSVKSLLIAHEGCSTHSSWRLRALFLWNCTRMSSVWDSRVR